MTDPGPLNRLESLQLTVLAPSSTAVSGLVAEPAVDSLRHRALLAKVARLRAHADLEGGAEVSAGHDRSSWHILALRGDGGEVAGGVRFRIHDLRQERPSAADCLAYADIRITDPASVAQLSHALDGHIAAQHERGSGFYQVGGFVVAPDARSTGVGLVLAVTTSVLVERLGLRGGCIFATTTNKVDALLCAVGGYRLRFDDRELPPFYCERHRASGVLLGAEAGRLDESLRPMEAPVAERLRAAAVLAPA